MTLIQPVGNRKDSHPSEAVISTPNPYLERGRDPAPVRHDGQALYLYGLVCKLLGERGGHKVEGGGGKTPTVKHRQ
jgi:hypothetical protein